MARQPDEIYGPQSNPESEQSDQTQNTQEETGKSQSQTSIWGPITTALLIIAIGLTWVYFAAKLTGHPGLAGPVKMFTHPVYGGWTILFSFMLVLIVLLSIKMGIVSWAPARKLILWTVILILPYILIITLWPSFSLRETIKEIPKHFQETSTSASTGGNDRRREKEEIGCKIYPPGTYTFSLKAGETLDHWILLPNGVTPWVESGDDKFKLLYSDGQIVPVWTPGDLPNKNKFKFVAVTEQKKITMIIK